MIGTIHIAVVLVFAGWLWLIREAALANRRRRFLEDLPPSPWSTEPPLVTVIIAARNEAREVERCLSSLFCQDYPHLEIIAVNDGSDDETGEIMERLAAVSKGRLRVLHLSNRPEGWLGKCYALSCAAQEAAGEYLLFTDADVVFAPPAISRAMAGVLQEKADMLCVFPCLELKSVGEKLFALGFIQLFFAAFRPHRVMEKRARAYVGVGAFNLIRRSLYERVGGHRSLRLTVVDDVALGKLAKIAGGKIAVYSSRDFVRVHWQEGLLGSIRGVEKNAFAGLNYSWIRTLGACAVVLSLWWLPWFGLAAVRGANLLALSALSLQLLLGSGAAIALGLAPAWGVFAPVSVTLCVFALLRSAVLTTVRRGVVWRGTSYPLRDLKKYNKF